MSSQIVFRPPSDLSDPPLPPEIVARIIARRARVSVAHAATVISLAGLGPQAREARQ